MLHSVVASSTTYKTSQVYPDQGVMLVDDIADNLDGAHVIRN